MTDRVANINKTLVFIVGVLLAVFISSFLFIPPLLSVFIIFVGICVWLCEKIYKKEVSQEVILLLLIIISVGLGSLRYGVKDFHEDVLPTLNGIVISEPAEKENSTRFILRSSNGEKIIVSTDLYSPVMYGDEVRVEGKLDKPGVIEEEDGRTFDYAKFLSKDDIYYTLNFGKVEVVSRGHASSIKRGLLRIKGALVSRIKAILPEPESSLLAGLIVAGKAGMPQAILDEFKRAGVIHIVVLSGYNITIIADFIRKIFEQIFTRVKLPRMPQLAAGTSLFLILLFVLATGAEATVVRAALMVSTVIAAKLFGRNYSAHRALIAAAFIMILVNPKILVFDPSFQLSFIATASLIYISPLISRLIKRLSDKWGVRSMLATTIGTQIGVLPFLIYSMGQLSLVSFPTNILILLVIPYAMLLGFAAALLAFASPILALPISYLTHLILAWILFVAELFGNLSYASVGVPTFSFSLVVLAYIGLIIALWRLRIYFRHSANLS